MTVRIIAALGLVGLAIACTPAAEKTDAVASAEATCPDDGPRLAVTNKCVGRAVNFLDPEVLMSSEVLPEGCTWRVNDAIWPGGEEAILYQAAECNGKVTQLEVRAGARSASIGYVTSGVFDPIPEDFEPVRIFTTEGQADPKAAILEMARQTTENKKEAAACEIQPLNPPDATVLKEAFVIDVNDAYKKANNINDEEAYSACGPYGVTDATRYWEIRQGYAWFVDFGQDLPDFNASSILIMQKDANGEWAPKP